jgi:hypothetical protein
MKKCIVVFLLLLGSAAVCAQQKSHSLDYMKSGEYAFYLDKRGGDNFYRGYLRISSGENESIILVRSIDLNKGKEERFMFLVADDDPSNIKGIQGDYAKDSASSQALLDFLNYTTLYLNHQDQFEVQGSVEDLWNEFGYTLVFSFNKILPFFRFYDIKMKGRNESSYTLQYGGVINGDTIDPFFEMEPIKRSPEKPRVVPAIPAKAAKKVEQNGVSITLDENWNFDNSTQLSGYWLALSSVRDSQIAIERMNLRPSTGLTKAQEDALASENELLLLRYVVSNLQNMIQMDTVKYSKTKNGSQIECYLWDENNSKNYQRAIISSTKDRVVIINFSAFADIYDKNKAYYEKILGSIVVGK